MKFYRRVLDRIPDIWLIALLAMFLNSSPSIAVEPSVVTLLYFRGVGQNNAIRLEWATGTELHTVGFRIERATTSNGPYLLLNEIGFVPSEASPDGLSGAEYDAIDSSDVANGTTYWYRLIDIEGNGAENRSSPLSVTAGLTAATSTSASTPNRTPTAVATTGLTAVSTASSTSAATRQTGPLPSTSTTPVPESRLTPNSPSGTTPTGSTDPAPATGDSTGHNELVVDNPVIQATIVGYPGPDAASTPQPISRNGVGAYPGDSQDGFFGSPDAYPASQEAVRTGREFEPQTGVSAATGPAAIGQGNAADSSPNSERSEQEPAATLMLWVGFLAALVILIAAVIGSAYIYRRQSRK